MNIFASLKLFSLSTSLFTGARGSRSSIGNSTHSLSTPSKLAGRPLMILFSIWTFSLHSDLSTLVATVISPESESWAAFSTNFRFLPTLIMVNLGSSSRMGLPFWYHVTSASSASQSISKAASSVSKTSCPLSLLVKVCGYSVSI